MDFNRANFCLDMTNDFLFQSINERPMVAERFLLI